VFACLKVGGAQRPFARPGQVLQASLEMLHPGTGEGATRLGAQAFKQGLETHAQRLGDMARQQTQGKLRAAQVAQDEIGPRAPLALLGRPQRGGQQQPRQFIQAVAGFGQSADDQRNRHEWMLVQAAAIGKAPRYGSLACAWQLQPGCEQRKKGAFNEAAARLRIGAGDEDIGRPFGSFGGLQQAITYRGGQVLKLLIGVGMARSRHDSTRPDGLRGHDLAARLLQGRDQPPLLRRE
jgi:hypothetical protein